VNKILVVDDDLDILEVVHILLTLNKFTVRTISRGESVDQEVREFTPDLILLDVSLGTTDGRVICQRLKSSPGTSRIPVILFSAHFDLVNNISGCHADDVITKPFEVADMLGKIRKTLAASES